VSMFFVALFVGIFAMPKARKIWAPMP
jgi:hypothetical protein